MQIQCECGKFQAELVRMKDSPGRLVCYCDDCQRYMHYLGRADLLDPIGGTEIVPAYPAHIQIQSGLAVLVCTRLAPHGMFRWSTSCCRTPIANTTPKRPWAGIHARTFTVKDPRFLQKTFGEIRGRIMGKFAQGTPPAGTPDRMNLRAILTVLPFLLKGAIFGKKKPSPFFKEDGQTPIHEPRILNQK